MTEWFDVNAPSLVKPSRTSARLARDLAPSANPRWYVFEVGYGEEVPVTVPVHLVPAWVDRRRLRRVLRLLWWPVVDGDLPEEGARVLVYENICPGTAYSWETSQEQEELFRANHELAIRHGIQVPDAMFSRVLGLDDLPPRLRMWDGVVGSVADSRGGALLLQDRVWFHEHVLEDPALVDEVHRLLGIKPRVSH